MAQATLTKMRGRNFLDCIKTFDELRRDTLLCNEKVAKRLCVRRARKNDKKLLKMTQKGPQIRSKTNVILKYLLFDL